MKHLDSLLADFNLSAAELRSAPIDVDLSHHADEEPAECLVPEIVLAVTMFFQPHAPPPCPVIHVEAAALEQASVDLGALPQARGFVLESELPIEFRTRAGSTTRIDTAAAERQILVEFDKGADADAVVGYQDGKPALVVAREGRRLQVLVASTGGASDQSDRDATAAGDAGAELPTISVISEDLRGTMQSWVADLGGEEMLEILGETWQGLDAWSAAAIAGALVRLGRPTALSPIDELDHLLNGEAIPALIAPRVWSEGWSSEQIDELVRLSLAVLDRLETVLDDLDEGLEDPGIGDPGWQGLMRELRHTRDDFESVLLLLGRAAPPELLEAVADFDRDAARFVASLPDACIQHSPRAEAAHRVNPSWWWTSPGGSQTHLS